MLKDSIVVSEDIFGKAARRYCERVGLDPFEMRYFASNEQRIREELGILCEKILALYEVGALPR